MTSNGSVPSQPPTPTLPVSDAILHKWLEIARLMASLMGVTSAVVMRAHSSVEVEVLVTNDSTANPLRPGERIRVTPEIYCERVLRTRRMVAVEDATTDPEWCDIRSAPMGMRSYLGVPLLWPEGRIFGSMCLMDPQPRAFNDEIRRLLQHFRSAVEMDLRLLVEQDRQRAMQAQLAEAQHLARLGSWQWDKDSDHITASDEFLRIFGLPQGAALTPQAYLDCVHPDDRAAVADPDRYVTPWSRARTTTFRIVRPDGSIRVLREHIDVAHDETQTMVRAWGTVQDITEQVEAERLLRQAAVEEERGRMLARFVRDLAHKIKTPLSVIETSLYIIERAPDTARRSQHASIIRTQTQTIATQLDVFTQLVRLDVPDVLKRSPARIDVLLREAVAVARQRHSERAVTVDLEAETLPASIVYETELASAFFQLVDNAIRYTPDGGGVSVRLTQAQDWLRVVVQDTGIGMPDDVLAHAFDQFYRGDPARTTRGLGMGLPIAQKVAQLHGGHIEVESAPGAGSTFTLLLPIVLPMGNS